MPHPFMVRRSLVGFALIVWLPALAGACVHATKQASKMPAPPPPQPVAEVPPPPTPVVPPPPPEDPVLTLIADSQRRFEAGQKAVADGHAEAAKQEFDKAIGILLTSPYGGRVEPRVREHFDRLVDRISAYEVKALAQGDGFTEKQYEPASIDELLAASATFLPTAPKQGLHDTVSTDLQTNQHDIPIPLNQRVLAFVELFQGRLHDFLQEGLERGAKYLPMIQDVLRAEGLPLDLAFVPLVESAFKPNALSRAKAKGVWQFMRGTGLENGLEQDWYIDERSDPEKATVAAAKYLGTLANMFDGDWHLALASYNGGPGRLQRAMKASNLTDFWAMAAKPRLLPRETRDYVPMILAAVIIAKNPAQYGFELITAPRHTYDTVSLPRPVDLRRVAEWADTTIDEIQALNPELRRWTTPVRDTAYPLKVPTGTAGRVAARLTEATTEDLSSLNWYVVKKGDTLATIAKKLRVGRTDLTEANFLNSTARVNPGQKLVVPREATALMAGRADRPMPVADTALITADKVVHAVSVTTASSDAERVRLVYRVKQGDTLNSIARAFGTTVASIQNWNRINGSHIQAGDRLTIYTTRANN
jgi:membrane-bound lytic murein transglycosylase D